jgi:hypothetical protein
MPEVNITTNVSPATVNTLRMNLYNSKAPTAVLATLEQAWNEENIWTFTDLTPGVNYIYNLFEVDSNGIVLQQYTKNPNFTSRSAGSIAVKSPQDIQVGVTPGLVAGTTSATFSDWAGWDVTIEDIGAGTMQRGVGYAYDIATGTLTLLGSGHVFINTQRFFVRFEPKVIAASIATRDLWSDIKLIADNISLDPTDAGKKMIIVGNPTFLNINLPLINTASNSIFWFESAKGNHINATITSLNGNAIDWMEGGKTRLYIGQSENIAIYRYNDTWRVHSYEGNFLTVGTEFTSHANSYINAVPLDGSQLNKDEYPRLYEWILNLPTDLRVPFDSWLGNNTLNRFKYSLANSAGFFRVPDVRGQYQVNAGSSGLVVGKTGATEVRPGDFQSQTMLDVRVAMFSDGVPINGKPSKSSPVAWSSNRQNGNEDYDLLIGNGEPTLGVSGVLVDKFGVPIPVDSKLTTDRYASRRFVLI